MNIDDLLRIAMERRASDLHLKVGNYPHLRIDGDLGVQIGKSVARNGTIVTTSKIRLVLRKEPTVLGYYVRSARSPSIAELAEFVSALPPPEG